MYKVLYRKCRPKTFADVYGQPHVTKALQNEVQNQRLSHAYLFTGSRGTGKTSCAKILAKAVNCLHPVDGNPCNECEICRGIDNGSILDVVEIDAASNNGVDSIRDLRDEVHFAPASAKFRVYIIDEVHMLSTGAFNALLKTLEEPPEHVIFILATTEVQKLPATILSRCQRFDFARIAPEEIQACMQQIAQKESFELTEEAGLMIARLADGGMRDALSLLDQCIAQNSRVTPEVVSQIVGMTDQTYLCGLSDALYEKDCGKALTLVHSIYESACDMQQLCRQMMEYFRNLMILKSVSKPENLIIMTAEERSELEKDAKRFDLLTIFHVLDTLQAAMERLKSGGNQRMEMELVMMQICSPELDTSSAALLRRIQELENKLLLLSSQGISAPAAPDASPESVSADAAQEDVFDEPAASADEGEAEDSVTQAAETEFPKWQDVLERLATACPPLYGVLVQSKATLAGNMIKVHTDNGLFVSLLKNDGNRQVLMNVIKDVTGQRYRIGVQKALVEKPNQKDPLGDFLRHSQSLGVEIQMK